MSAPETAKRGRMQPRHRDRGLRRQRIRHVLAFGPLALDELAQVLDLPVHTVRRSLLEMSDVEEVVTYRTRGAA